MGCAERPQEAELARVLPCAQPTVTGLPKNPASADEEPLKRQRRRELEAPGGAKCRDDSASAQHLLEPETDEVALPPPYCAAVNVIDHLRLPLHFVLTM